MIEKSGLVNPLCGGYCCHSLVYGLVSGAIRLCYKLKLKRAWRAPYRLSWLVISPQAATENPGRCLAGGTVATARYSRGGRIAGIWW